MNFCSRFLRLSVFPWCKDSPQIVMLWWEWLGRLKWRATVLKASVLFRSASRRWPRSWKRSSPGNKVAEQQAFRFGESEKHEWEGPSPQLSRGQSIAICHGNACYAISFILFSLYCDYRSLKVRVLLFFFNVYRSIANKRWTMYESRIWSTWYCYSVIQNLFCAVVPRQPSY